MIKDFCTQLLMGFDLTHIYNNIKGYEKALFAMILIVHSTDTGYNTTRSLNIQFRAYQTILQ